MISRRVILRVGIAALAARPIAASAQPSVGQKRLGVLMVGLPGSRESRRKAAALTEGLDALGWHDGGNLLIDWRWAEGTPARFDRAAAALLDLAADVVVAAGSLSTKMLRQRTDKVPVVFVHVTDPIGQGFAASLAHPGGNLTGFSIYDPPMAGKWIELLTQISPIADVAVLFDPATTPYADLYMRVLQDAASTTAVAVEKAPCRNDAEIEAAIAGLAPRRSGVLVLPNTFSDVHRDAIIAAVAAHRLPAIYPNPIFTASGGLMSYGVDLTDLFRRAAGYVDRILRGEKPADLPIQAPVRFDLAINLKTAKALGLTIPPSLLARADEVIE